MFDSNELTPEGQMAEMNIRLARQAERIEQLQNQFEFASQAVDSWKRRFDKIKASLNEFIEEDEISEGSPLSDYLIEEFDLETTKEVEVKITVYYSALITIPRKSDVEDFADYLDIPDSLSLSEGEIDRISVDDASIEEA